MSAGAQSGSSETAIEKTAARFEVFGKFIAAVGDEIAGRHKKAVRAF